jgi:hypothetical protein
MTQHQSIALIVVVLCFMLMVAHIPGTFAGHSSSSGSHEYGHTHWHKPYSYYGGYSHYGHGGYGYHG